MSKEKRLLTGTWGGVRRAPDDKGRLSLVAEWARALILDNADSNIPPARKRDTVLAFIKADRPAIVISLAAWHRLEPKKRERRYLLKYEVRIDGMGRIQLPEDARRYLGTEMFLQHAGGNIRLWPAALWDQTFGRPLKKVESSPHIARASR